MDATGREITDADYTQTAALGAAMFAAVAVGAQVGRYGDLIDLSRHMARVRGESFVPIPEHLCSLCKLHNRASLDGCEAKNKAR